MTLDCGNYCIILIMGIYIINRSFKHLNPKSLQPQGQTGHAPRRPHRIQSARARCPACTSQTQNAPGLGFRVQGLGCTVKGLGCRVKGSGFRIQGLGLRVQGLEFRV